MKFIIYHLSGCLFELIFLYLFHQILTKSRLICWLVGYLIILNMLFYIMYMLFV
jgi:hypothetical protein